MINCLVLLDYSKAFDLINQELLIDKLSYYGLTNLSCLWFSNYLKDIVQIVEVEGIRANSAVTKHGIAQGSILGPILFLYGGETQILKSFDFMDANSALHEINSDLDRIAD